MRAKMIFSAYRIDDFADPDGFAVQVGMVLERYDDDIIRYVTDPITGVQRHCKFPPSISEIVDACEARAIQNATVQRYRAMPDRLRLPAPPPQPGHRANVFVPPEAPQYGAMVDKAGKPDSDPLDYKYERGGISVTLAWLHEMPRYRIPHTRQAG